MSEIRWYVTLLDRGREITVEVSGRTKDAARAAAKLLHPQGHTVHVERTKEQPE